MKENKNENVCEMNFDGRFSEELPWRVVQHITSDEDHHSFGALSSNSPRRVVQYILPKLGSKFSRTRNFFFLKRDILLAFGLGICEGVGEDSGHGRDSSCRHLSRFM